jgi:hypothetical protein
MIVRPPTPITAVITRKTRQLLRLNPAQREFRVVHADNDLEIAIPARSMLQFIVFSPQRDASMSRCFPD